MQENINKSCVISRWVKSAKNSQHGFKVLWQEKSFREECGIGVIVALFMYFLPFTLVYKLILLFALMMLLIIEAINSAIEATVDRISTDIHPLSKKAKDIGSAMVTMTILMNVMLWLVVIYLTIADYMTS